jgi:peptide/nickel transport system permease protein
VAVLVLKTVARGVAVVILVLLAIFVVGYVIGDPARLAVPLGASHQEYESVRASLGLNDPFVTQFVRFWRQVFTLNFGDSFWQHQPALGIAVSRLPASLELLGAAFGLALGAGTALGVIAATRRDTWLDRAISAMNTVFAATPNFWIGIVFILVFAVNLRLFPTSGNGGARSLVLPAVTLSLASVGRISQTVRASLLAEQGRPYARFARAKGMSSARILRVHTARNAGVAITTFSLWELIRLVTGAGVVVEVIFAWPGIGQLAIQAVQHQDFPLIEACVLVVTVVVVVINLIAELVYGALDPRLRETRVVTTA